MMVAGTGNFSDFWRYWNRYQKNLVPEKVSESVSVTEIFGTGKKYRYRYRLISWVLSHSADCKNGFWKGFLFVDHWFNAAIITMHR